MPLQQCHGTDPTTYNVLDNPQLPQGIKDYSNQPTSPQVYLNCKFMEEVVTFFCRCTRTGELVEELKKLGYLLCPLRWNRRSGLKVRVTEPAATGVRSTLPEKPYQFWFSLFRCPIQGYWSAKPNCHNMWQIFWSLSVGLKTQLLNNIWKHFETSYKPEERERKLRSGTWGLEFSLVPRPGAPVQCFSNRIQDLLVGLEISLVSWGYIF